MLLTDGLMLNGGFCSCWLQVKAGRTGFNFHQKLLVFLVPPWIFPSLLYKGRFTCPSSPGTLGILCYIFLITYSLLGGVVFWGVFFSLVSWLDLLLPRLSLDTLVAPSLCNSSLICYTGKAQPCRRETTSILQLWRCHAAYLFPPLLSRTTVAHMLWPV